MKGISKELQELVSIGDSFSKQFEDNPIAAEMGIMFCDLFLKSIKEKEASLHRQLRLNPAPGINIPPEEKGVENKILLNKGKEAELNFTEVDSELYNKIQRIPFLFHKSNPKK